MPEEYSESTDGACCRLDVGWLFIYAFILILKQLYLKFPDFEGTTQPTN